MGSVINDVSFRRNVQHFFFVDLESTYVRGLIVDFEYRVCVKLPRRQLHSLKTAVEIDRPNTMYVVRGWMMVVRSEVTVQQQRQQEPIRLIVGCGRELVRVLLGNGASIVGYEK